jgi:hypothetical protein
LALPRVKPAKQEKERRGRGYIVTYRTTPLGSFTARFGKRYIMKFKKGFSNEMTSDLNTDTEIFYSI